jgi:deazaflavin-dependent oxidoreductase (nitroreductase family)
MATATTGLRERLAQESEIQITVTGRKTGRPITNTVWFVLEGNKLYLLPVKGTDSQWFKNVLANPRIKISVEDVEGELKVTPTTDPNIVSSVVERFRKKYGAEDVKKYYSKFDAAVAVDLG